MRTVLNMGHKFPHYQMHWNNTILENYLSRDFRYKM